MKKKQNIVEHLENTLTTDEKREMFDKRTKDILSDSECWNFNKMKINKGVAKLFQHINQAYIKQLRMSSNQRPEIIRQVSNISFQTLTMLDLGSNKIRSIEGLERLQMPMMERLNLYNNQITSVKSLRKCGLKKLIYLSVAANPIIPNLETLIELEGSSMLWLWLENREKKLAIGEDLSWLLKTNWQKLSELMIRSHNLRIHKQNRIDRMLMERFKQIYISDD